MIREVLDPKIVSNSKSLQPPVHQPVTKITKGINLISSCSVLFLFFTRHPFFLRRPMVSAGWLVRRKDWTWELLLTPTVVDVLASPLCFTLIKRERFLSYVAMVNNLDICRVGLDNASRVCHFRIQTLVKIGTRIPAIWVQAIFHMDSCACVLEPIYSE